MVEIETENGGIWVLGKTGVSPVGNSQLLELLHNLEREETFKKHINTLLSSTSARSEMTCIVCIECF